MDRRRSHPWEPVLPEVGRPQQYTGGEWNLELPPPAHLPRVTLVYPDVYELGMSNLGLSVLRHVLLSSGGLDVRRAFHPAPDMLEVMRREGLPWVDLEDGSPVGGSRVVGFGVAAESLYTNVLGLIDLAGMPLRSEDRAEEHPLVLLGGGGLSNPLPLAPFADLFFLGEVEERAEELFRLLAGPGGREKRLEAAGRVPGVWVPLHGPKRVELQRVGRLREEWAPVDQLVPTARISHDRAVVEVARGCTRGCRFCQASQLGRPVREREPGVSVDLLRRALRSTGWEKGGLLSLSLSDHSGIRELMELAGTLEEELRVRVGRPSLRPDTVCRLSGAGIGSGNLTMAPEAGSERLRDIINKPLSDGELLGAVDAAFGMGAASVKLYFMVGLPGETPEDVRAISELAGELASVAGRHGRRPRKAVNLALSPFVPKAHTPFQWSRVLPPEEAWERIRAVRRGARGVSVSWNSPRVALVEAVLGLGGAGIADLLEEAFRLGARFDAWTDRFDWGLWSGVLERRRHQWEHLLRERDPREEPDWGFVDTGVSGDWLRSERERALERQPTPDCRVSGCLGCGACGGEAVRAGEGDRPATRPDGSPERAGEIRAVLRARYAKEGLGRFSSHLDMVRMWSRTARRSGLPLSYSGGYVSRPRLHFGPALALGIPSRSEYVDLLLEEVPEGDPGELLAGSLPVDYRLLGTAMMPPGTPPPEEEAALSVWELRPAGEPGDDLEEALAGLPGHVRSESRGKGVVRVVAACTARPDRALAGAGLEADGLVRSDLLRVDGSSLMDPPSNEG